MDDCQELIGLVAEQTTGSSNLTYQGQAIGLDPPWPRLSVDEAFRRYASVGAEEALAADWFVGVWVSECEALGGTRRPRVRLG